MQRNWMGFWWDEAGASAAEYAILLTLVGVSVALAFAGLSSSIGDRMDRSSSTIASLGAAPAADTGAAPASSPGRSGDAPGHTGAAPGLGGSGPPGLTGGAPGKSKP